MGKFFHGKSKRVSGRLRELREPSAESVEGLTWTILITFVAIDDGVSNLTNVDQTDDRSNLKCLAKK